MAWNVCLDGRALLAGGLPPGPLATPVTLFRSVNGRLYHVSPTCDKASRSLLTSPVTVDVLTTKVTLCSSCSWSSSTHLDAVRAWLDRAEVIIRASRVLDDVEAAAPNQESFDQATSVVVDLAGVGSDDELGEVAVALGRRARAEVERHGDVERTLLVLAASGAGRRSATELHGADVVQLLLGHPACCLEDGFDRVVAALGDGATLDDAITVGVDAIRDTTAPGPVAFTELPSRTRFPGGGFSSPFAWAQAEWQAAFADAVDGLAHRWSAAISAIRASYEASRWVLGAGGGGDEEALVRAAYPSRAAGRFNLACGPETALRQAGFYLIDPATAVEPCDAGSVVQVAASLVADDDGFWPDLGDDDRLARAVEAAAAIVSPATISR